MPPMRLEVMARAKAWCDALKVEIWGKAALKRASKAADDASSAAVSDASASRRHQLQSSDELEND